MQYVDLWIADSGDSWDRQGGVTWDDPGSPHDQIDHCTQEQRVTSRHAEPSTVINHFSLCCHSEPANKWSNLGHHCVPRPSAVYYMLRKIQRLLQKYATVVNSTNTLGFKTAKKVHLEKKAWTPVYNSCQGFLLS